MSRLRLSFFGLPYMERDGEAVEVDTRKAVALIAYLAITGQAHSREALAALLWPEYDAERAFANLRRTLWALNKAVGQEWLEADAQSLDLRRGPDLWVDVAAFRHHLAESEAHEHPSLESCSACLRSLTTAADLYCGDFMAGFTLRDSPGFDDWQFFEREDLRRELASALERLAECHGMRGEFELAITYARRWLALDPLHEPAHRALMRLYAWDGQFAAASRQYEQCVQILEEELGVAPEEETAQLYEAVRTRQLPPRPGAEAGARRVPSAEAPPPGLLHNLQPQPTPFVGRRRELLEIARLLRDPNCRLLSLVGPGGIGKTRLAHQAAVKELEATPDLYPQGVFAVRLAALESAEFIVPTVASSVGFSFFQREGEDPQRQLLNYLREKQMLLVLDNFEQLMEGAELLADMLREAPGVKLLVTTRERLNLRGEWILEVAGMRFPQDGDGDPEPAEAYSAVQLFLQRASQVDAAFSPTAEEVQEIIRICRLVDGMPLGIELAAAWVKMLSVREIAQEIARSLDFLVTSLRDVPERHRNLRAVCDHSWQLLPEREKGVFKRLSVFRGRFQRAAAEQVAGADLSLLSALADKSLLRRDPSGRYEVHEVLRQYAAEKLGEVLEEQAETRDRHGRYYAAYLQQRERDLKGARQTEALDEIGAEIENVRAAWRWAVTQCRVVELEQAAESLFHFYEMRSQFQEGAEAFEQAVASLRSEACRSAGWGTRREAALGLALAFQGFLGYYFYSREKVQALMRQSLQVLHPLGASRERALASLLIMVSWAEQDPADVEEMFQESKSFYREEGDRWGVARCLLLWADRRPHADDVEFVKNLEEALAICEEIGDRRGVGHALFSLGEFAHEIGAYGEAKRYFQESLALSREMGNHQGTAISLDFLGYVGREMGEFDEAQRVHEESLRIGREIGDQLGVAGSLDNLGLVARDRGDFDEAERLLKEGLAIRRAVGAGWETCVSLENLGEVALAKGAYEQAGRLYRESRAIREDPARLVDVGLVGRGLGEVATALGETEQARQFFRAALELFSQHRTVRFRLDTLLGIAGLSARLGQDERSAELAVFVLHHPGSPKYVQDRAERLLTELRSRLAADVLARAEEWGVDRTLTEVEAAVLEEL